MLGGCANHNDCAFLFPPPSDFDHWASLGAKGWSAADLAPYFARIAERVNVELAPTHPASRVFIEAGKERGLPEVDFRDAVVPGVGLFPLNARGRTRQSSSIAYLHPLSALAQASRNLDRHFRIETPLRRPSRRRRRNHRAVPSVPRAP